MKMPSKRRSHLTMTLGAVADPTRRAILKRLADGEARFTDLALPFMISLNAVSKHIRILERARLVRRRRSGREHILSFHPEALNDAATWIETNRALWTTRLNNLDAMLQAEDQAVTSISK